MTVMHFTFHLHHIFSCVSVYLFFSSFFFCGEINLSRSHCIAFLSFSMMHSCFVFEDVCSHANRFTCTAYDKLKVLIVLLKSINMSFFTQAVNFTSFFNLSLVFFCQDAELFYLVRMSKRIMVYATTIAHANSLSFPRIVYL